MDLMGRTVSKKTELVFNNELFDICIIPSAGYATVKYYFSLINEGHSTIRSIDLYINPGFKVTKCADAFGKPIEYENSVYDSLECLTGPSYLIRKLILHKEIFPGEKRDCIIDLQGIPIQFTYKQCIKDEISDIYLWRFLRHQYTSGVKKVYLSMPNSYYPVIVDENTTEFKNVSFSSAWISFWKSINGEYNFSTYAYVTLGSFHADIGDFAYAEKDSDGVKIKVHLAKSDKKLMQSVIRTATKAIKKYSKSFCQYPHKDYTVVACDKSGLFPIAIGGSSLSMYEQLDNYYLLAHEIAHAWFLSILTPAREEDRWLSEGGASYCEILMGEKRKDFKEHLNELIKEYLLKNREGDKPLVSTDRDYSVLYGKGAMVFRSLQFTMGSKRFFEFLHNVFEERRNKKTDTDKFIEIANRYGDLSWFFDEWLYRSGVPDFAIENIFYKNNMLKFNIAQKQNELYKTPLEIHIYLTDGTKIKKTCWIRHRTTSVIYDLRKKAKKIYLDPSCKILKFYDPLKECPEDKWTYIL